jgi:hypothetical protein
MVLQGPRVLGVAVVPDEIGRQDLIKVVWVQLVVLAGCLFVLL